MISYVWNVDFMLRPGVGGTENFTLGHVRELLSRGIATEVITLWQGENDGRGYFPDIPFRHLHPSALAHLNHPLVFSSIPAPFATKQVAFVHAPYPRPASAKARALCSQSLNRKIVMAPSQAAARAWGRYLGMTSDTIRVVYPFAVPEFATVQALPATAGPTKVLFASRLIPEKGIYTLLNALHFLPEDAFTFTATEVGSDHAHGETIKTLLQAHPRFTVVPAQTTYKAMAELMAAHDIVVVPSNKAWQEPFGMVSVEAQHAGCRVVASNNAGIPETDCGGLILVRPDDPQALAKGLLKAAKRGRLSAAERQQAAKKFTVGASVDSLLDIISETLGDRAWLANE